MWAIDEKVKEQVKHYYAEITSKGVIPKKSEPSKELHAKFTGLEPDTEYTARVATVYTGGAISYSESHSFKTPGLLVSCWTHKECA